VLRALPVGEVWLPNGAATESGFDEVRVAARERGVPVRERGADSPEWSVGDLRATPLWPPRAGGGSRNDRSLVIRFDVAGHRVLLPGDIEAGAEAALVERRAPLRAEVLVLPHHGSRTSSSAAFLDAVDPEVAIVSAPCEGRFGMPHAAVLQRLYARSLSFWWTGRDGAVRVGLSTPLLAIGTGDGFHPESNACDRPVSERSFRYDERAVATAVVAGGGGVR
jgi:competence protein ComEC